MPAQKLKEERGFALLLTLLIVVILTVLILEFSSWVMVDITTASNFLNNQKSYYLSKTGINFFIAALKHQETYDLNIKNNTAENWEKWQSLSQILYAIPLEEGRINMQIKDEQGKLNIANPCPPANIAASPTPNPPPGGTNSPPPLSMLSGQRLFNILQNNFSFNQEQMDSLCDWIDTNSDKHTEGGEEPYYQSLEKPYHIKDGPLTSISEIKMIKGFDEEAIRKLKIENDKTGITELGLSENFTLYPKDEKVNINTVPREIYEKLDWNMVPTIINSAETVEDFFKERKNKKEGFKDINDLEKTLIAIKTISNPVTPGEHDFLAKTFLFAGDFFSLESVGTFIINHTKDEGITTKITAVLHRINAKEVKILYWKKT